MVTVEISVELDVSLIQCIKDVGTFRILFFIPLSPHLLQILFYTTALLDNFFPLTKITVSDLLLLRTSKKY